MKRTARGRSLKKRRLERPGTDRRAVTSPRDSRPKAPRQRARPRRPTPHRHRCPSDPDPARQRNAGEARAWARPCRRSGRRPCPRETGPTSSASTARDGAGARTAGTPGASGLTKARLISIRRTKAPGRRTRTSTVRSPASADDCDWFFAGGVFVISVPPGPRPSADGTSRDRGPGVPADQQQARPRPTADAGGPSSPESRRDPPEPESSAPGRG